MAKLCSVMQWTLSVIVSDINFGTIQQKELNSCNRTLTYEYIYTVFRKKVVHLVFEHNFTTTSSVFLQFFLQFSAETLVK